MEGMGGDKDIAYTKLMLSIPRGVTISVACHTVAYDYATITQPTTRPLPPYTYKSRFEGVYAASIAIRGRDGKFLTPKEFRVLIGEAKKYLAAATQYINDGEQWLPGPLTGSYRRLIRSVDSTYNDADPNDVPRWAQTRTALGNVGALIAMLGRYSRVAGLPGAEPIKQSPLMVGCTSRRMDTRCKQHLPENKMANTTHTWALTLCLLKHMGLSPEVVTIPVLVTLEQDDLPTAERLVSTLAQSHIGQLGYNIVEGGGKHDVITPSEAGLLDMYVHVHVDAGWVLKQMKAAQKELQHRVELNAEASRLNDRDLHILAQHKRD